MIVGSKTIDTNGWTEIKDNPLSKVGVFPYSGAQISPELEPDKIYYVYRPENELADQACIDSFKLVPWTDEHAMLGSEDEGLLPAEQKGIQGVIGEEVYYKDGYLKGNIKIFSETLSRLIADGKKALSIGYRCVYDIESGSYNGQKYDAIQRNIRGNHLALVDEGRAGPDVAVQDQLKYTFDSLELKMADQTTETKDEEITLESLNDKIEAIRQIVEKLTSASDEEEKPATLDEDEEKKDDKKTEDADEDKEDDKKAEDADEDKEKASAMDAQLKQVTKELNDLKNNGLKTLLREVSKRDALANELSQYIGTFDHAEKSVDEVAAYGIKKLGLQAVKGQEHAVLSGYLAAKKSMSHVQATSMDGADVESDQIDALINGE